MFFPIQKYILRKECGSLPRNKLKGRKIYNKEKASLFASGSLTVEAACVLPLFLMTMIAMMILIQATAISCRISEGLHEAGKQMALLAYAKEKTDIEVNKYVTGAISYVYVQDKVQERLKEDDIQVIFLRSKILNDNEIIDLVADYVLDTPLAIIKPNRIKLLQRARVRAWTGRKLANEEDSTDSESDKTVYVTVNGSVYHRDRECSHIRLSIRTVNHSTVADMRNKDGGKYYPCSGCKGGSDQVYITDTGNRYHGSISCSSLKRGVISVTETEVKSWSPCSRCGG